MKKIILFLTFITLSVSSVAKKKTVRYRKHTEFNFSGDRVDGKLKEAGVFYIFQRKRSDQHELRPFPRNTKNYKLINKKVIEEKIKI